MVRFVKQRDRFRCGPVAILNALKFFGKKCDYSYLKRISNSCHCWGKDGTKSGKFDKALRRLGKRFFRVRRTYNCSFDKIDGALRKNKLVIVNYTWIDERKTPHGHYTVLVRDESYNYYAINNYRGKTIYPFYMDAFRSKGQRNNIIKEMWVLSKV